MSDLDPNDQTTLTDLDATTGVPAPTAPLTPSAPLTPPGEGPTNPIPQPYEPAVAWAPAVPVARPSTGQRSSRLRWAAAIGVVAVVLGATAAVAALITNTATTATVMGYVPPQTVAYAEVRLDFPGDQRQAVGAFLSKFPGFADQAALDGKIDEVLDEFVKSATNDDQTYTADIKPWFDGELALSVGPLPPVDSLTGGSSASMDQVRALALLSIKDATAAQAWFDAAIKESGATTTTESYGGATLTVVAQSDAPKAAFAIIGGEVAAMGDLTSVKAAVDTKGASGFASEPGPKAALASGNGDHVGFAYIALRPLLDWSMELDDTLSGDFGGAATAAISDTMLKAFPDWAAYWLRFENDAAIMEATAPKPETVIGPTENRTSKIVEHVPSSAIVVSVSHDLGATLGQALTMYASEPSFKEMLDQLDQALGLAGGRDAALGWLGDTAVVVNDSNGTPEGGVLVDPTDPEAAKRLFTALGTLIGIGGGNQGITVRTEPYAGTTITIIDLGDAGQLTGMGGANVGIPGPTGRVEIAYAVTDDIVVVGSGPAFVKHVLDTTASTSLASDAQYKDLAARAGTGTGSMFVDITAIRQMAEKVMAGADPAAMAKYETDVKPFLVPLDAMFGSTSTGGDLTSTTVIITVK